MQHYTAGDADAFGLCGPGGKGGKAGAAESMAMEKIVDNNQPSILEGIEDQFGAKWLRLGTADRNMWVPLVALGSLSGRTLDGLQKVGFTLVSQHTKEKFKKTVEMFDRYRRAPIAAHAGWVGDTYVHPDHSRYRLGGAPDDLIVAFERDPRFAPGSSLKAWQTALDPLVREQPLPLVLLSFAFVGPLLRFMPPDVQNPIVELVGERERGKSSLAYAASAVIGGDSDNRMGIARSWNFSAQKIDDMRADFSDGLLVLDEANLAGEKDRERVEKIKLAVFRLAETSPRERFGDAPGLQVRQAILSTSNMPLQELVGSNDEVQAAVISRVLTLYANRRYGIFDSLPAGFDGAVAAAALMNGSASHTAVAAHAFSAALMRFPPNRIRTAVRKGMNKAVSYFIRRGLDPRHAKILATIHVAGRIARQLKVLPAGWGSISDACKAMIEVPSQRPASNASIPALDVIKRYIQNHRADIVTLEDVTSPLDPAQFDSFAGFLRRDGSQIIIPSSTKFDLPGAEAVFRQLKKEGRLSHDAGNFTKKAPRAITRGRRAYFVRLA